MWFNALKQEITTINSGDTQALLERSVITQRLLKRSAVTPEISSINAKDPSEDKMFCAVKHPVYGTYIDLSQLSTNPNTNTPDGNGKKKNKKNNNNNNNKQPTLPVKTRWSVNGWDYTTNFTLGICSSAVDEDTEHSSRTLASIGEVSKNKTGAFYYENDEARIHNKYTSIGEYSTNPQFMGKKLVLQYDNGDMCPNGIDRRTSLLNFVCDKEISSRAQINFIGSAHNCSYFFEVRSIYACPTTAVEDDYNVIGIFFFIVVVFVLVEYGRRRLSRFVHSRGGSSTDISEGDTQGNRVYMNNSNNNSMDSLSYLNYINPRWARIENESKFKNFAKNVFTKLRDLFKRRSGSDTDERNGNNKSFYYNTRTSRNNYKLRTADNGSVINNQINLSNNSRNSRGSNDTLFRDIEIQNNLMDSLQMDNIDEDEDVGAGGGGGGNVITDGSVDNSNDQRDLLSDDLV
ncbi:hypothetical protein ACO0QE_003018 [Hanseniaspora vineae]